jgi:hypothetical protein
VKNINAAGLFWILYLAAIALAAIAWRFWS